MGTLEFLPGLAGAFSHCWWGWVPDSGDKLNNFELQAFRGWLLWPGHRAIRTTGERPAGFVTHRAEPVGTHARRADPAGAGGGRDLLWPSSGCGRGKHFFRDLGA